MASTCAKFSNNFKLLKTLVNNFSYRALSTNFIPIIHRNACKFVESASHRSQMRPLSGASAATGQKNETDSERKEREKEEQQKMDEEEGKKREAAWKTLKYTMWGFGGTFAVLGTWAICDLGRPAIDSEGNAVRDEYSDLPIVEQYMRRVWGQLNYFKKMIQEPSREKLLPDPVTYPYIQPPYTLVLELRDLLVHPEWTYETGWRFKKRPGVDYFLEQVGNPKFEIVVYTAEPGLTVFPILDALDSKGHIMYRLVRDSTHFQDGRHVKDLARLNRDLSRVIVVDWDATAVEPRQNALVIGRWRGDDKDTALLDLAALLRTIHDMGVEDVRDTLAYYSQFDDPLTAFTENRRKLAEKLEEEQQKASAQKGAWAPSFLKKKPLIQ